MISAPAGATIYTFDGVSFYREGGDRVQPWFNARAEVTRDIVLGANDIDYVHIGAGTRDELEIRAIVFDTSVRDALLTKALQATTATLAKTPGTLSQYATLIKAVPDDPKSKGYYVVVLTFVPRTLI